MELSGLMGVVVRLNTQVALFRVRLARVDDCIDELNDDWLQMISSDSRASAAIICDLLFNTTNNLLNGHSSSGIAPMAQS